MEKHNSLYRAVDKYKNELSKDNNVLSLSKAIFKSIKEGDKLEATHSYCLIHEEWIEKIEKYLVFVENAIREDRQFLLKTGEVLPIEKIKRVSPASVKHLARHSELLTKKPKEGEDIIPDKLFMQENVSDYTIYENRFLYMLLCNTRDFLDIRLNGIFDSGNSYKLNLKMNKNLKIFSRDISFDFSLSDRNSQDPYSDFDAKTIEYIARIEDLYQIVLSLLNTTLMKEVSKVAMVKPPITKTNVLKMNNNFKHALELYYFITSFEGDGYTIKEKTNILDPIPENFCQDISETIAINSFLAYMYGFKKNEKYKDEFDEENRQSKEAQTAIAVQKMRELREKLAKGECSVEEYILKLEERNKLIEKDAKELNEAKKKITEIKSENGKLKEIITEHEGKIIYLKELIEKKLEIIEQLKQKYIDDMKVLKLKHKEEVDNLCAMHESQIAELNENHQAELDERDATRAREIQEAEDLLNSTIQAADKKFNEAMEDARNELNNVILEAAETLENTKKEAEKKYNEAMENAEKKFSDAEAKFEREISISENKYNEAEAQYIAAISAAELKYGEAAAKADEIVSSLNVRLEETIIEYQAKYENGIKEQKEKFELNINSINGDFANQIKKLEHNLSAMTEQRDLIFAQLNALKAQYGLLTEGDDFTSKEKFTELENQLEAFVRLFNNQWKDAKQKIKSDVLKKIPRSIRKKSSKKTDLYDGNADEK